MATKLTENEKKLIAHAKEAVARYNRQRHAKGDIDTIYAFVMSDSGRIYDGACLESSIGSGAVCAERLAIGRMILEETYKARIISIVTFDPVPEKQGYSSTPCGTCRHVIWEQGTPETTIICGQYIQRKSGWEFVPKMEKYTIREMYPKAYKKVEWG